MSETVVIAVLLLAIASSITAIELLRADERRPLHRIVERVTRSNIAWAIRTRIGRDPAPPSVARGANGPDAEPIMDAEELSYRIGVPGA